MRAQADIQRRPSFAEERGLMREGHRFIAGIDEVGRGPLAGPVVAAAVILPPNLKADWLPMVRDSKQLTPRRREALLPFIEEASLAIGVGHTPPEVIDSLGIVRATKMAMCSAVAQLRYPPDCLLIDFVALTELALPQRSIVKGDRRSLSIACASIVAKVTRDRIMVELNELHPGYGFARNKGYATREHLASLRRLGACPIHRRRFSPVTATL